MADLLNLLETKVSSQLNLCRILLELAQEQRHAVKSRDLSKFEETTRILADELHQFSSGQDEMKNLCAEYKNVKGYPEDASIISLLDHSSHDQEERLKENLRELVDTAEKLRKVNEGNLYLINNSLQVMRQIIQLAYPGDQVIYENNGSIRANRLATTALNKTV